MSAFLFTILFLVSPVMQTANAADAGAARAMNPDIGANFLTWYRQNTSHLNQGWSIQEAEFTMKADVDPYLTANAIFSVAPETGKSFSIEPEEIYVETIFIPKLTLKAGKFYEAFGKHNLLHTHAYPFIDAPLVNLALFGDGGLNGTGVSGAYLLPTPWYGELSVQTFDNFRQLAHVRNLFELNDDTTLEFGASAVTKWAWGGDVTLKHRPTSVGQGQRFNLGAEWMSGVKDQSQGNPTQGLYSFAQYEFLPRTYIEYRFDDVLSAQQTRHGALLAYAPSEFSVFRIQYDVSKQPNVRTEQRVLAQVNITIGFHPAHDY